MKNKSLILLLSITFALWVEYVYPETSTALITNSKMYDKKIVTFTGEIIGEMMQRGKYTWLNISDGEAMIGVFASIDIIPEITYFGGYKAKGDILSITGIFNRACSMHGGELDIHAISIEKVKQGHNIIHQPSPGKIKLVLLLALVAIIIISINHLRGLKNRNIS
jgi:hypothetical protein